MHNSGDLCKIEEISEKMQTSSLSQNFFVTLRQV